ncbi:MULTISPECIES: penicillin-binding protein 1A [Sphingomonas]|uniref:Penicillin-binding protein 1A n=3 Tax=Sphingomonas paucimobilis TaxID=13689 RepID=A0A411LJB1_SPHPI|nr:MULTISPECIES: transglycosylase domain-containing protein [Sphingomonas]MBQ1479016.1 transglycosylase domain-containing protein [Sphingomonas sp.]MCM3678509.1 transglycosylase domain-containing protein [Sphingomonas paucimobilis]NNG56046.1 penicillin-binding protein [Sphingomonas paucimobilis]QBE92401.1 penicillin-binding protein [Sphingomonas paucimobilis]QPS17432.1 transglycosylase domain-containing protein [Sphingomonas paucimobilis]
MAVDPSHPSDSPETPRRRLWSRWWVKALAALALLAAIGAGVFWLVFMRDLPSVDALKAYEPPLPTHVRGIDGTPIQSYARERRVELSYNEYPPLLVRAFLAAEDKSFFEHGGVDYPGLAGAVLDYAKKMGSGRRARGGSTITQQVAKNLLIGNAYSPTRKIREAILAYKIEATLTKPQILELYLNQIALGRNAFGVEAAAHAYFDKELNELTLGQMAYLAVLPKGPSNYDPIRHPDRALERRAYVLREMLSNNFITRAQYDAAMAEPLGTVLRRTPKYAQVGGYFVEEVRRQLIKQFGENAQSGPHSVYEGGLWVRTSYDKRLQDLATEALRDGLVRFEGGRGWSGPIRHVDLDGDNWQQALLNTNIGLDYRDWRAAIVTAKDTGEATIGFANGRTGTLPRSAAQMPRRGTAATAFSALKVGDIIAVAPQGSDFGLRSVPRISGGFVVEEPASGRVLAMQGGFDARLQAFNRATQAERQPGSTIKPIVYSAALDHGMTPASIIVDGPFCVDQGAGLGTKCFRNFGNSAGAGPHTMRWGIEQSRNLMTVRTASTVGMKNVVAMIKQMGIGDFPPYLAYALGAGETTVSQMVNAYAILANNGRGGDPSLIDFVQDRHGKVIWPENWRACDRCNMADYDGKPMPRPVTHQRQVLDAMTAYQMVHITEGVIQRGTATGLRDLDRPMFGKTGTNNGPTDVWFVGGTPQFVGGLYIGYDHPRSLGGYAQGGTIAVPIFHQFAVKAYEGLEKLPFRAAPGIRMVRIDRASGRPVYGTFPTGNDPKPAVIWEAFKPESEPRRRARRAAEATTQSAPAPTGPATPAPPRDSDFLQREGGIY